MKKEIKQILSNHPDGTQEFIEMDLLPLIIDLAEELKEDDLGDTPSKNNA